MTSFVTTDDTAFLVQKNDTKFFLPLEEEVEEDEAVTTAADDYYYWSSSTSTTSDDNEDSWSVGPKEEEEEDGERELIFEKKLNHCHQPTRGTSLLSCLLQQQQKQSSPSQQGIHSTTYTPSPLSSLKRCQSRYQHLNEWFTNTLASS